jgi:hypothetical protein
VFNLPAIISLLHAGLQAQPPPGLWAVLECLCNRLPAVVVEHPYITVCVLPSPCASVPWFMQCNCPGFRQYSCSPGHFALEHSSQCALLGRHGM